MFPNVTAAWTKSNGQKIAPHQNSTDKKQWEMKKKRTKE